MTLNLWCDKTLQFIDVYYIATIKQTSHHKRLLKLVTQVSLLLTSIRMRRQQIELGRGIPPGTLAKACQSHPAGSSSNGRQTQFTMDDNILLFLIF